LGVNHEGAVVVPGLLTNVEDRNCCGEAKGRVKETRALCKRGTGKYIGFQAGAANNRDWEEETPVVLETVMRAGGKFPEGQTV